MVFSRKIPNSFLQVSFREPYWIKFWLQLSKEEEKVFFENNCVLIEGRVLELFAIRGGISGIG